MNETIMKELDELPDEIKVIENRILACVFKKSEIKKLMDSWEITEIAKITEETIKSEDNKHKNRYPNDITRKAELENRKNNSVVYHQFRKDYLEKDSLDKKDQVEFNYKTNRFRAVRKMVDLIAARRK